MSKCSERSNVSFHLLHWGTTKYVGSYRTNADFPEFNLRKVFLSFLGSQRKDVKCVFISKQELDFDNLHLSHKYSVTRNRNKTTIISPISKDF